MADEQVPQAWVGEDVVVFELEEHTANGRYGRLEYVGESGLVLRHYDLVYWGQVNRSGEREHNEYRVVANFYPWHNVRRFRLQEEEEKKEYGLE